MLTAPARLAHERTRVLADLYATAHDTFSEVIQRVAEAAPGAAVMAQESGCLILVPGSVRTSVEWYAPCVSYLLIVAPLPDGTVTTVLRVGERHCQHEGEA